MTRLGKLAVRVGLLSLVSALPLAAEIGNGVDFTTAFAFYAGATKLPAGSYKITQPNMNNHVLEIASTDGTKSAFVNFTPTESVEPYGRSLVTFHQYGGADYLDRVSIAGDTDGVMLDPAKTELKAKANANVADRPIVSSGE
jgi:hypothetical protein